MTRFVIVDKDGRFFSAFGLSPQWSTRSAILFESEDIARKEGIGAVLMNVSAKSRKRRESEVIIRPIKIG